MNIANNIENKLQQRVLDTIRDNRLLQQGDGVVVGVSGGPDSVCLLHVLYCLSKILDLRLHAVHINHMLRAAESEADEAYTAGLCAELGVPLSVARINVARMAAESGMSLEEAGRKARYGEFDRIAAEVGAAAVAVAHNRNDQAETVMLHIIRGSGITGLTGMDFRRGAVIRPLLNIYRSEIEEYCKAAALSPRTDSSNLKADFSRNKVRLELFPYINRNFRADITESLCRLSVSAAEDSDYLEQCARTAYESSLQDGKQTGSRVGAALDLRQLGALHQAVLFRVLRMAVSDAAGNCTGIGKTHYQALCRLVQSGRTGMRAELPGGIRGEISYNRLLIFQAVPDGDAAAPERGAAPFEMCLEIPGKTTIPELDAFIDAAVEQPGAVDKYGRLGYNSFVQFFDYDCIKRGMNIRNRRDGDVFKPFGSTGTKKLKEYFIDQKIPRGLRNDIPLVCVNNEVVWVVGYKISDKFKVTENTKSVLRMEYSRRII